LVPIGTDGRGCVARLGAVAQAWGVRFAWLFGVMVLGCGGTAARPEPREPVANAAGTAAREAPEATRVEEGPALEDAEKAELKRMFAEGKAEYDAGNFGDAAVLFEKIYARWPKPAILFNVAQARRQNGEIGKALAALRQMQTMELSTHMRDEVDRVIKAIESQNPPNQANQNQPTP
jgi:hypothetical protein